MFALCLNELTKSRGSTLRLHCYVQQRRLAESLPSWICSYIMLFREYCMYWRCLSSDISSTGHRPHLLTIRPNSCIPNQFNFYLLLAQGEVVTEDWTLGKTLKHIKIKIYVNQPNRSTPTSGFLSSCLASTRRCVVCCCGCCWGFGGLKSGWNHQSQGTM